MVLSTGVGNCKEISGIPLTDATFILPAMFDFFRYSFYISCQTAAMGMGIQHMNNGHHLILGRLEDYISGEILNDTHDERYRQAIARLLVEEKGYQRGDIEPRHKLLVRAGDRSAVVVVDFIVHLDERAGMIVKYGPGSLVTRRRPGLAASRLLAPYQIPVVVVTNGEDAEIVEGSTGNLIAAGLESIPMKSDLEKRAAALGFLPISNTRAEMESRIVYAFEVDGACPCDDTVCKL
jgi:hypothetical protein